MSKTGQWRIGGLQQLWVALATITLVTIWVVTGRSTTPEPLTNPGVLYHLVNTQSLSSCVSSVRCLESVGGVAFDAVAQPANGVTISNIRYDASAADGQRLRVAVRMSGIDQEIVAPLYDWQLIPIARFANGAQAAIFTLFGSLVDAKQTDAVRAQGYDILNYHAAVSDTLLGLRLFQADVLVLSVASADLPHFAANQYLLGAGEVAPNVQANQQALSTVGSQMLDSTGQQPFQSYIVSDYAQSVTFSLQNQTLVLDGYPYWYFWRYSVNSTQFKAIGDTAAAEANAQLNEEFSADQQTMSNAQLAEKYTSEYQQARFDTLFDGIFSPQVLQALPDYSVKISNQIRVNNGINPAVYDALTLTMRYAALFRYVRAVAPSAYEAFIKSFDCERPEPNLFTPGAYIAGGELLLPAGTTPGPDGCPDAGSTTSDAGSSTSTSTSTSTSADDPNNTQGMPYVGTCSCKLVRATHAGSFAFGVVLASIVIAGLRRRTQWNRR